MRFFAAALMVATAVALLLVQAPAASADDLKVDAPSTTVFVERAAVAHKQKDKLWFHLDALVASEDSAGARAGGASAADLSSSSSSSDDSEESSGAVDPDREESQREKVVKDKKGGATTVVQNRNFMSLTEDMSGNELDPVHAAAEARLEAEEQFAKRSAEAQQKHKAEAKTKAERRATEEQDNKGRVAEAVSDKERALREVREAQEATNKVNDRRRTEWQARRSAEENNKLFSNINLNQAKWKNYGETYSPARANQQNDISMLSGLVRGFNELIGTLPQESRPGGRIMFSQLNAAGLARVDILADGRIEYIAGPQGGWLSLAGMDFASGNNQAIQLADKWSAYGGSWRAPGVRIVGGICMVSGLLRTSVPEGQWGDIVTLPEACRTDQRLVFRTCNHRWITRLDVVGNTIKFAGGSSKHGWASLEGISFAVGEGGTPLDAETDLNRHGGWVNYGGEYRKAAYHINGRICSLSGLVRNTKFPQFDTEDARLVVTLPKKCRPLGRLIFTTLSSHARLDVLPDGSVVYVSGKAQDVDWLSLSMIKFYTAQ